jgi:Fic family protein
MGVAQTWELLGVLRRFAGTSCPIPTPDGEEFWYSLDGGALRCLELIARHCRSESSLHQMLREREGHRFLVRCRVEEAIATCRLDGVVVDQRRTSDMLQDGRAPRTPAERLVLNSYEMLTELESVTQEPFSPQLVRSLYDRVTSGVDVAALDRGPARPDLDGMPNPAASRAGSEDPGMLEAICDYANGVTGDPAEPLAVKAFMLLSITAYARPLRDLNDTVGRHLLRLFAVSRDYPVLSYLPTSLMRLRWLDHTLEPGIARFDTLEHRPVIPGSMDGTEDILTHLQLTTAALIELLGYIERARQEDVALHKALDAAAHLNYRQRSVLAQALANPGSQFRIRQHQTSHRVVYQTARTDLLDLVDRGYLHKEDRGRAFVFLPSSGLLRLVNGVSPR